MRKIKYRVSAAVFLLLSVTVLLGACRGTKITELNERLIIEAIGVDIGSGGEYIVTVQAIDSESPASGGDSEDSQPLTKTLVFTGSSVGEALNGISVHTGKTPLYSQARVLIIGFEAAKKDIGKVLDFFLREYTTRTDIFIAVSEKSAKEMLGASFEKNSIGATVIENALRSGEYTGRVVSIPLYKFVNLLLDDKSGAFCPVLSIQKEPLADSCRVNCIGTALFTDNKISAVMTPEQTRGLLFLIDKISSADIPVGTDKGLFTLRVVSNKTKIKAPDSSGGAFAIKITTECDITEFESSRFSKLTTNAVNEAQLVCRDIILEEARDAISFSYYRNNCDICRLERRRWLSSPTQYRAEFPDEADNEKHFDTTISVEVKIRRTGKETLGEEK